MSEHAHEFTLLYSHFGWYRDKNTHYHQCFDCEALLVGDGRQCSGDRGDHRIEDAADFAASLAAVPVDGETTT